MSTNRLLERLGITHPVILGPMGGGPSTPELVAAVSEAGGLGSLGASYMTPDEMIQAIEKIKSLTERPFAVNLFVGGQEQRPVDPQPMLQIMGEIHEELGLAAPVLPAPRPDPFPEQFEAVLLERPPVFSFTFGIPDAARLDKLREYGIRILGMATSVEEGQRLAVAGVDGLVAQGEEAGAHRGTFLNPLEDVRLPTRALVEEMVADLSVPVIAAGGLMDGRDLAEVMALGACAGQFGTAFLCCPESGASQAYKLALLAAKEDTTEVTRVFSGRPARGLRNAFTARLRDSEEDILPYPLQNQLTRAMRSAAAQKGESNYLSLWAGRGVHRIRVMGAGALVRRLVEEMNSANKGVG